MRFIVKVAGIVLATTVPALAGNYPSTTAPPGLADSTEPGSVLVFPAFFQQSVEVYPGTPGAFNSALTVIEVSAKCPDGVASGCPEQTLRLHAHWVCPGVVNADDSPSVCPESDFIRTITFGSFAEGTITFNPSGIPSPPGSDYNGTTVVPVAPCDRGFLLVYVEDSVGFPVKFDGLIGTARIRNGSGGGVAAYKATSIQADPQLPNWEQSNDGSGASRVALGPLGSLVFDGKPGHYLQTVGQASGQVSWDSMTKPPFHLDHLILMTLDVRSGLPNTATGVPVNFFNKYETQLSDGVAFVCWTDVLLEDISADLTVENFGSDNNGVPGPATSVGDFRTDQAFDITSGQPRTLLGIFLSNERSSSNPANHSGAAQFIREFSNNSIGVPTAFAPKQ